MPNCEACQGVLVRAHRRLWEKLFFISAHTCRDCGRRKRVSYLDGTLIHPHVVCPRCGTSSPSKRGKADKIDAMMRSPYRMLHMLLGGALYHCKYCRLQFHDIRPYRPEPEPVNPNATPVNTATTAN